MCKKRLIFAGAGRVIVVIVRAAIVAVIVYVRISVRIALKVALKVALELRPRAVVRAKGAASQ
jgi:hypothetical protein